MKWLGIALVAAAFLLHPGDELSEHVEEASRGTHWPTPALLIGLLLAYALQKTDAHSALGAQIYVWARLLYIPAYVLGIPFLRTLIWAASLAGILMVLSAYWPGM